MRTGIVVALTLALFAPSASAQTQLPNQDEIIQRTRNAFKNAKTKEEVEGVKLWCADSIRALDFKSQDRLMVEAIKLMETGKIDEANARLKTVSDMKDLADNLARIVCRPEIY